MRKYYQLMLVVVCAVSFVSLLVYRHQYNHLRYVLSVLNFFGRANDGAPCNVGFNATSLSDRLDARGFAPYFQRIDDDHYAYSTFWQRRVSKTLDVHAEHYGASDTLVLGSKRAKPNFRCHFVAEDGDRPLVGKFSYSRLDSKAVPDNKKYLLYIFHCKLARPTAVPYAVSYYPNSDLNPFSSPVLRMLDIDRKSTLPIDWSNVSFENKFKIIACVMPNALPTVDKRNVIEFLSFHNLLGISEFHIYDNSLSANILRKLQFLPSELIGFTLNVLPFNFPFSTEDGYHAMRDLAELDCSFRSLNRNRHFEVNDVRSDERISHIVNLSWDEFIVPRYHYLLKPFIGKYENGKKVKLQLPALHFCTQQRNDPKVKEDYPDIVKKTHYDKSISSERPSYIYNIGSMNENDISMSPSLVQTDSESLQKVEKVSQEIIAVHKYVDCKQSSDRGTKNTNAGVNDIETRPHQFEGAMLRFAEDLYNTQLYKLYRAEKIWSPIK